MWRQDGAGEFGEEALDEIEPGAVLGREGELEAASAATPRREGLNGKGVKRLSDGTN
jgi:hypothetical protein